MKHEIEIPGLLEGWRAVAYRIPTENGRFLSNDIPPMVMFDSSNSHKLPAVIVEKIQSREITLVETDEIKEIKRQYLNNEISSYELFQYITEKLPEIRS